MPRWLQIAALVALVLVVMLAAVIARYMQDSLFLSPGVAAGAGAGAGGSLVSSLVWTSFGALVATVGPRVVSTGGAGQRVDGGMFVALPIKNKTTRI